MELPAGTGAKPMYKNIAWCTGLGITEEGDWNGGNLSNDHAALRASTYHSGHRARDLWLFDIRTTSPHNWV